MPKKMKNDGQVSSNVKNIQNVRKTKEIIHFGLLQEI
jgi:hypothetical protein